ncbi:MAG: RecQ family ATP-dependent DNA helicase [Verrucomicrobiales bacterium]|nr:RecQ family ATP-dependent DNA helicase [Verrucomicrobiales bacterium]
MSHSVATEKLQKHFGFDEFRSGQRQVIEQLMVGVNTLAVFPTGGGKSLCYQYPAVVREDGALTVVVSPLIALMRDQVDALLQKGLAAGRLDSSCSPEQREEVLQAVQQGDLALLYVSPEGLADEELLKLLCSVEVALVAVDEAHCVSEWGHSFRPAYLRLPKLIRKLKPGAVLALTATATTQVASEVRKVFGMQKKNEVRTPFHRANLHYHIHPVADGDARRLRLLELLQDEKRLPCVVYATRREDVEGLAAFLCAQGIEARSYHAGMNAQGRAEVQDGFMNHDFQVICATIAFGMGVDMADIRCVVHYHAPKSPEGWMQESGRAGRDGKTAYCELLACADDRLVLENFVQANRPSVRVIENVLRGIFSQGRMAVISRYDLQTLYDLPEAVVDILLARLELAHFLQLKGHAWKRARLRFLTGRDELLSSYVGKKKKAIKVLLEQKGNLDLIDLSCEVEMKIEALNDLLEELEVGGDLGLTRTHRLLLYRVMRVPDSMGELAREMYEAFDLHSERDLKRIGDVFQLAVTRACITSALLKHFGEKLEGTCGECSSCLGEKRARKLPGSVVEEVSLEEIERVQALVATRHAVLASPQRLARFLCGINSPAMRRWRLYFKPDWGLLKRLPYDEVLAIVQAQVM